MSDQIQDQVSAFVDDELSLDECMFLVRRFERDLDARRKVTSYLTIGAALRGELVHPDPAALRERLELAMADRRGQQAANESRGGRLSALARRSLKPLAGAAIAASVAVAAVVVLRTGQEVGANPGVAPAVGTVAAARVEPRSYVVPQEVSGSRTVTQQPIRLTNYLVHHGEFASGLGRTWIHSSVVGTQEALAVPEEETTEQ